MQHPSSKAAKASGVLITGCFLSRNRFSTACIWLMGIAIYIIPFSLHAQDTTKILPNGTDGLVFTPRAADTVFIDKKSDLAPNEFEGTHSTFRIGGGYIGDYTAYSQDKVFKQQMDSAGLDLNAHYQTRDFRILASGRFLKTKRYIAWKFAYMYDGDKKVWMLRESGLTIGVPKLFGFLFIGRTKEGLSLPKVMNGHSPWANERTMATDPIPILADGIKWFGYIPKSRIFWNLGAYNDFISKGQSFSTFSSQYIARIGWLPVYNKQTNKVLHIAFEYQYGKPVNGKFTVKSRPESNPTPQLINTGEFDAKYSHHYGGEIYYRTGRFLIGSEFFSHNFYAEKAPDHHFYGGNVDMSYFFTKTSRPYNTEGSIFGFVPVHKSVFKGGWGEWEGVLRFTTSDLNDKDIQGGKFTRITPMVNWYLSKALRMEFIYGYGTLDRFNLKGHVQFFETRLQVTVM
jgi:phosphate-selective porin OprO/OprP